MSRALCVPIYCSCGARTVWTADVQWLAKEGLDATASPFFEFVNLDLTAAAPILEAAHE